MINFKGVIFDFDGTLADTLEDLGDSMNRVLTTRGFPEHEYESYKLFVGRGLENLVKYALPQDYRIPEIIAPALNDMKEDYINNCLIKSRLYDGIPDLLDDLTRRNIKLSVFSNKASDILKKMTDNLIGNWSFEKIIGTSPEIPKKPDPEGALLICREMNILPEEMIYLGDSGVDMITAAAAGIFSVGVLWGFRSEKELRENGAKKLIARPMDLLK
jgi:phosphoglycolate phosphatase